mgnify:CR=1 FL=1
MLNHVVIMGRITRDPELRRTNSGLAVASFSLACDRDYQAKDAQEKETDFINCVAWRSTAEYVTKYFPKGRMAIVTGRLQVRSYTDKEGNKRTASEVVVDNIYYGDYSRPQSMASSFDGGQSGSSYQNSGYQSGGYAGNSGSYQSGGNSGRTNNAQSTGSFANSDFSILEDDDSNLPF